MGDWSKNLGTLSEDALSRLAEMLDNPTRGWRQLANTVNEHPQLRCSESELTSCSVQVLSPTGSPTRYLLARLADRSCSLALLLSCLKKIDHQHAVQYLTATVMEQIHITVQPQAQQGLEGGRVVLTCRAAGPAGLSYQWFRGKEQILGDTGSAADLVLCPLGPVHQGHYICRVNHGENCTFSQWAHIRLGRSENSSPGCSSTLFPGSKSGLCITRQPRSQTVTEGDTLFLECHAEANPPAQYHWYHNMKELQHQKHSVLRIPAMTTAHRGQYSCRVYTLFHETWSNPVKVHIATDKVALLIGNMNYVHHTQLCAPMADVHELANLLRQLDFKVVSLLDLNWQEMNSAVTEFLLLLDKGVYGLLYFAGHGYENYGNSFMVPIDAPASYTSDHCLCVQSVLQRMQERETGLNVFLLDMCRKRNPNDDVIPRSGPLKVTANIVFGYATCVDAEAYEVKRDDLNNGIFISFLKQRLCEDEKVTVMLDRVAEGMYYMGRCELMRGRQALELRSNLSERRALTDRIQNTESCTDNSTRNLQWAIAHVLPKSRKLHFECGVQVQIGFAAEFSNIMIIYTRILEKPQEIVSCSAELIDFPEEGVDLDLKKSNQESIIEAGSLLPIMENMPSPQSPSLYTRLKSLQRLKTELTFSVCVHYRYSNMEDEEVQETQSVTVGKPLVSKLNLHEPRLPRSSSADFHSFNAPETSLYAEDLGPDFPSSETLSFGSASTTWSYYSQAATEQPRSNSPTTLRVNIPEENAIAELMECPPQPLTSSQSLTQSQITQETSRFNDPYNFHSY
ncbi:Mucosa-associated lymphoid tissue lymphoma translocation protein 1 [Merluccius polli]|uniref:Mucosa-associated lymphoid tissue lymphoma translocation protein 1 n=1 Tax=Merluccius polli TaxID=89951 RepID=A0AA47M1Y3_MERPO|nr:Mucosa-associated lymphoid tissue lymphoma translocation protein 1 [Merluccius polli]